MAKDILLYGAIWQYNTMYFFEQVKEALKDDPEAELNLRINCEGGSPDYGMSIIAKLQEMGDKFSIIGEGQLHSMALFSLCYVSKDKVTVLDTSKGILHRAAYPNWIESNDAFKGSIYEEILAKTNKDLEKAFRNRVNVEALENLPQFTEKNLKLKDIFSMEGRSEVLLTGSDMKKIGLVDSVTKVTPSKSAAMAAMFEDFKKCVTIDDFKMAAQVTANENTNTEKSNSTDMNLDEIKSKHPALYAQIVALGVSQERDRVGAWMAFVNIDAAEVAKGIKSGENISQTAMAEFTVKGMSAEALQKVAATNAPAVTTGEAPAPKTEKERELAEAEANMRKMMGLK